MLLLPGWIQKRRSIKRFDERRRRNHGKGTTSDCQRGSRQPEQMRVVCGCPMHGEISQDLANTGAEFEAMAGEPGGDDDVALLRKYIKDEVLVR
jgi:hypothetical protein